MADLVCVDHPLETHVTGDKFCFRCGTPLTERERCKCHRDLLAFYIYCPQCGKIIERKPK